MCRFTGVFYLMGGVAGVRERLPKADIAAHSRRRGCVGDAALRGSDQGEPPTAVPPPEALDLSAVPPPRTLSAATIFSRL